MLEGTLEVVWSTPPQSRASVDQGAQGFVWPSSEYL